MSFGQDSNKQVIQKVYPLSSMQQGMLFNALLGNQIGEYSEQAVFLIHGDLDLETLEKSFNALIERHDIFRTNFVYENIRKPQQVVLKNRTAKISYEDLSYLDKPVAEQYVREFCKADREKEYNLTKDILTRMHVFKTGNKEFQMVWGFHHIIMDGWCLGIVLDDFYSIYNSFKHNTVMNASIPFPYQNYIKWIEKQDKEEAIQFWKDYLYGFEQKSEVPICHKYEKKEGYMQESVNFTIDELTVSKLIRMASSLKTTLSTLFQTIWGVLLSRYNNTNDVVFGVVISGRPPDIDGIEKMVGLFINTVPFRIKYSDSTTFSKLVSDNQKAYLKVDKYGYLPLGEIKSVTELKQDLIDHAIVFENYPLQDEVKNLSVQSDMGFDINDVKLVGQTNLNFNIVIEPGKCMTVDFRYNALAYERAFIENICGHMNQIIRHIINNPDILVNDIEILPENEKRFLIYDFNNTLASYDKHKTIHSLFEEQAGRAPDNIAVVYKGKSISYRELDEKSNQLSRILKLEGVKKGTIVALLMPRSIEMIIGLMGVLKAGGIFLPLDIDHPLSRKDFILKDSGAEILLQLQGYEYINDFNGKVIGINNNLLETYEKTSINVLCNSDDPAYIIYTSGSTGNPKGVILNHLGIFNHSLTKIKVMDITENDTVANNFSINVVASIWQILTPLFLGSKLVIHSEDVEKDPYEQFIRIREDNISIIELIPSILSAYIDLIEKGKNKIDIPQLRYIALTSEASKSVMVNKFYGLYNIPLVNCYGQTECSDDTLHYIVPIDTETTLIPIGTPSNNTQAYILDRKKHLQPIGVIGELCISGDGLADGYLNRPELNNEKFITSPIYPGKRMYRTGDLARLSMDGKIEYYGRIDHQVKIRGNRVELGEIENRLLKYPDIMQAVIIDRDDVSGNKYLCAFFTAHRELNVSELRAHIKEELPDYMVPSYFIRLEQMPLTPNGKIDRKVLPQPAMLINTGVEYQEPRDEIEEKLVVIWKDVLGVGKPGINESFFDLGGHSLSMIQVLACIGKDLKVNIKLKDFVEYNTISKVAELIRNEKSKEKEFIYNSKCPEPEKIEEPFPLTEVQTAYLLGRSNLYEIGGVSTHGYAEVEMEADLERFNACLQMLIKRHPMLRAVIGHDGKQRILRNVPEYKIKNIDISNLDKQGQHNCILKERERMSHYVFETDQWPLFEIIALKLTDRRYYMLMGYDLLIADSTSIRIIIKELNQYYDNPNLDLPEIEFTFRDYMIAYDEFKMSEVYKVDKDFWQKKLYDFPSAPKIPLSQEPSNIATPHFKRFSKDFDKVSWNKLKAIAKEYNITPSVLLCTVFAEVLAYWSNQPHMAINLTVFNRYPFHPDVNKIVGDFTSVILLDIDLNGKSGFHEKVNHIQSVFLDALEHRHFDGVEFIREISKNNNLGNKAVMPIVFTSALFNNYEANQWFGLGTDEEKMGISQTSQVYLDHQAIEMNGGLRINWDYVDELFDPETISSMFERYISILSRLLGEFNDISLEPDKRLQGVVNNYNCTYENIPATTLHQMIMEQVKRTPDNIAVMFENNSITYKELDERSNRVALYLREYGITANSFVGVIAQRCIETIINIVGILKAGGAYVPIDPEYPADRRKYIVSNSNCKLILDSDFYDENLLEGYYGSFITQFIDPENIAYVIYTSGSTGKPKGVVISHKAATNTIIDINRKFNVNENDRILGISSMCFDLSVYDIFGALSTGAALVMVRDQRDVIDLKEAVDKYKITIWNSVPAIMDVMVDSLENNPYRSKKSSNDTKQKYYWSPVLHWKRQGNKIIIGNKSFPDIPVEIFPDFYFLTQNGIATDDLIEQFSFVGTERMKTIIDDFIHNKIITSGLLTPREIFSSQDSLFESKYSQRLLLDAEELDRFKVKQLNRDFEKVTGETIQLQPYNEFPLFITERRTCRNFCESSKISFSTFSRMMSIFKQVRTNGDIKYFYASSGGLYPIDIFIYVKESRVENIRGGLYYYNPINNSLSMVSSGEVINEEAHYHSNRQIFASSAFSVFFIYNANTNMPKYGSLGYYLSFIDCGIMVSSLTQASELFDIGLCSIGNMDFGKVREFFRLNNNQMLLHTVECGLKPEGKRLVDGRSMNEPDAGIYEEENVILKNTMVDGISGLKHLSSLRLVLLSGDWIPLSLPGRIRKYFPGARIISLGGATEASIWSIYYPIDEVKEHWRSIPYGIPLANQKFYVCNYNTELSPIGVMGELYIGGTGVANGYLNDPAKTEEAFIHHPTLGYIYKTGDFGVLHANGLIEFMGRKDAQVKIRGYRIELGDIESSLQKHPDVKGAVVIDRIEENGKKYLCAYVISDKDINDLNLRQHLANSLPEYMVPSQYMQVVSFPLTANGKINKKGLPEPAKKIVTEKEYVGATDEIEKLLVDIWQKELDREKVSINDNFFDLGGNSLVLIRIYTKLQELFGDKVKVTDFFANSTIYRMAEFIRRQSQNTLKHSIKKATIEYIRLNKDYFNSEKEADMLLIGVLKYSSDKLLNDKLKSIAANERVDMPDILIASFISLFSQISGTKKISIEAAISETDYAYPISMDLTTIKDFMEVIRTVRNKRNEKGCVPGYNINEALKAEYSKFEDSVLVLLHEKGKVSQNVETLQLYDIILEFSSYSGNLDFVCRYNSSRMKGEKVKELFGNYLRILKIITDNYNSEYNN